MRYLRTKIFLEREEQTCVEDEVRQWLFQISNSDGTDKDAFAWMNIYTNILAATRIISGWLLSIVRERATAMNEKIAYWQSRSFQVRVKNLFICGSGRVSVWSLFSLSQPGYWGPRKPFHSYWKDQPRSFQSTLITSSCYHHFLNEEISSEVSNLPGTNP